MTYPDDDALVVESPDVRKYSISAKVNPEELQRTLEPSLGKEVSVTRPSLPNSSNSNRPISSNTVETCKTVVEEETTEIEAEDDATCVESADFQGDDNANIANEEDISSTISLGSSVTGFKYENGRRYHAQNDAQYFLPNDDIENDRLDLMHHLLTLRCNDRLHLAPIKEPKRILDLATGTGIWAIEMGDAYPSATIFGNDLSPVQPNLVPPKVIFEVDDIEAEWCFSARFDYIHCRYLAGSISDWPRLMKQAFKFTRPGGWVEFQDFDMRFYSTDGTFAPDCSANEWCNEIILALETMDREAEPGPKLENWVRDAGFINVNHQCLPIPVGLWPKDKRMKEIGACDLSMFLEGLEAISLRALTSARSWSREEVLGFLPHVRKNLKDRRVHAMHNFYVVWAQKPL